MSGQMKMKMEDIQNKKTLWYCIAAFLFLAGVLFLYWKAELQDRDRPIAHRTEVLTNEFELTVGEIRGINIKRKHTLQNVNLHLVIEDKNGNEIWENWYEDVDITDEYTEIEHFYPENLIDVPKGKYIAKFYLDNQEDSEIRGEFVEYRAGYGKYFIGFSALAIILILASIVVLKSNRKELSRTYFILAVLTGVFYSFIFPALSMPDEPTHFGEAYKISSTILGQPVCDEKGYIMLRADDYDSMTYLHNIDTLSEWYESTIHGSKTELVTSDRNFSISIRSKYAYVVPALGVTVARILNLSGKMLLSLGRFFNLLFTAAIIACAIRIAPRFRLFMSAIGLLPETILLMNSYSYDALNMAMSILVVAFFMHLCEKENICIKDVLAFMGLLLLYIPIKVVYLPFVLLLFLLPKGKINTNIKSKTIFFIAILAMVSVAVWGVLNLPYIFQLVFGGNANQDENIPVLISMQYVLANMKQIVIMYIRVLLENVYSDFQAMIGTMYSFGRFGNIEGYSTPAWLCIVVFDILAISLLGVDVKEINQRKKQFTITLIIVLGCAFAVATSMLFGCTFTNYRKIEGIQGRYFLPLLSLLPLLVKTKRIHFTISSEQMESRCLFLMQAVNLGFAWATMHYYTSMYFNI